MVVSKESGGVPAKERKQLHHNLLIPSIPPSTSTLCSIIQIKYALEIKIVVPSIHKTDKLKIPITIGTVPLRPENILGMHSLFPPGDEAASFVNLTPPIGTAERIELRPIVIETQPPPLPSQPPRYSDINPLASVEEFVNFPSEMLVVCPGLIFLTYLIFSSTVLRGVSLWNCSGRVGGSR